MKTIIVCGGIGYRLKEETEFKPKPMIFIGGKPILWHIMKIYSHYGFNEFVIALGYKGDVIKDYFLNQKFFANNFTLHTKTGNSKIHKGKVGSNSDNFVITFVDTGVETLVGERILRVKEFIPPTDSHFMVAYGDGVSNINIKKLVSFHKKQKTIGTVAGVHPRSTYGLLKTKHDGLVTEFVEKPLLEDWINGGFMIFKREFFKYLNPGETEHDGIKRLALKNQLSMYPHDNFWHCMDTYKDVATLNKMWEEGPEWKVWKD